LVAAAVHVHPCRLAIDKTMMPSFARLWPAGWQRVLVALSSRGRIAYRAAQCRDRKSLLTD
jgi:hypothetical protein